MRVLQEEQISMGGRMLFLLREGDFERKTRNPQKEEQYSMKSKVFETQDDNRGGEGSR